MRIILATIAAVLLIFGIVGGGIVYSGLYDVAATDRHWPAVRWALETARTRSIRAHAAGVDMPSRLDDPAQVLVGAEHFAAHCAVCHGAPGVPRGDIANGLYPRPPNLAGATTLYSPAELFWILKHGIKMTGMPAWSDHGDDELWATVAFIEKLPGMSEQEYAKLVMTTVMQGGGRHHHGAGDGAADPAGEHNESLPALPENHDSSRH
mgnify:CR=1 FL=1